MTFENQDGYANDGKSYDKRYLASYDQFKKGEKYPWRSVTFSKVVSFSLQLH